MAASTLSRHKQTQLPKSLLLLILNCSKMKKFKKVLIVLTVVVCSVYGYGVYLALQKPYIEDRPDQIVGLECEEYQFQWFNSESNDTIYSTAWEFKPEQVGLIDPIISAADTMWVLNRNDTVVKVHWSEDITTEVTSLNNKVLNYTIYWSASF